MSTFSYQNGDPDAPSPKRQKTSTSYVAVPASGGYGDVENDDNNHDGDKTPERQQKDPKILQPRAYQLEMLEESLRRNVIIAMETGSGKTQIAILRIREELGRCPSHKLVWFIAPTVVLAQQQYNVICQQLSASQTRLITGADNVDHWSSQAVWDTVLLNVRIVVSTPQVLLDALSHGFVPLQRLALLVFDEAHHCVRDAPANRILKEHYHYNLQKFGVTDNLPYILGMTASPTPDGSEKSLRALEESLNAICRTTRLNSEELMQYVNLPQMEITYYESYEDGQLAQECMFDSIVTSMNIEQDPLVKRLKLRSDNKSQRKLVAALTDGKTVCRKQVKTCFDRTTLMRKELGPWAADTFLAECRRRLRERCVKSEQQLRDDWAQWECEDNLYMLKALTQVRILPERERWDSIPDELASKASRLVGLLEEAYTSTCTTTIVFAKERATVTMLAHLISKHPRLKQVKCGPFLGSSSYESRKSHLVELADFRDQTDSVNELRTGTKNLLVSTSVLEEGVDIPACDLVICFDPPKNLRAFIQRRGRARKETSKFVIFLNQDDEASITLWMTLEKEMKNKYEDDMRALRLAEKRESIEEEGYEELRIPSTGALLTLDNSRSHLGYFCDTLTRTYTECEPDFIINWELDRAAAKVVLPNVLDPKLREFKGRSTWRTEKMARRDAAFQAYVALYEAGLVNDNMLPKHATDYKNIIEIDKRQGLAQVSSPLNAWREVAAQWGTADSFYRCIVDVASETHKLPQMVMVLPVSLPCDITFPLYWNEATTLTVSLKRTTTKFASGLLELARTSTHILLSSVFSARMVAERVDFSCLFLPKLARMTRDSVRKWCESATGTRSADGISSNDADVLENLGMVRLNEHSRYRRPLVAEKCLWMKRVAEDTSNDGIDIGEDANAAEELHFEGSAWPKRTDFLHTVQNVGAPRMHTSRRCHPVSECRIDKMPVQYARFAQFIPCILHNISSYLIAQELRQTILAPIAFTDLDLVLTSISASSAREARNYQRLEFYGDCQLKLHTSLQLAAGHPTWHEELLSRHKDGIVSNGRLSKAAIETGLHRFILLKPFTGAKWRPFYNSDYLTRAKEESTREISTKTLADVVESLIGAAMLDGGYEKALKCLQIFLPEEKWATYESRVQRLHDDAGSDDHTTSMSEPVLQQVEDLAGHEFSKKSLLVEALTHPSSPGPGLTYQRLEFMGDSVLDSIVVQALFDSPKEFPHYQMHLMRTALVNADFLAFLAMDTTTEVLRGEVSSDAKAVTTKTTVQRVALWEYMRHSASWNMLQDQQKASKRFDRCRAEITKALATSQTYPWALLSHVGAGKYFSDLIESMLGAIYIDSRASMAACHAFLERIGLLKYLRRVLGGEIDVMHPKQRLGMLAGKQNLKVQYLPEHAAEGDSGDRAVDELAPYECLVRVGEEDMAHSEGAVSKVEAETKAAEAAVATMRMRDVEIADAPVSSVTEEADDEMGDEPDAEDDEDESWIYSLD